jgi:hypothetical protein
MSEASLQREILQKFGSRPNVRLWRANAGRALVPTADGGLRPIQVNIPGCPDLIGFLAPSGRFLGIEVKAPNGRLRPAQEAFRDALTKAGGIYIVARSVEDVTRELP